MIRHLVLLSAVLACLPPELAAQVPDTGPPAALTLGELQRAAVARDPRTLQLALLDRQSALRQRNIDASRLPALSLDGSSQFQSDVAQAPVRLPTGEPLFTAPHTTTDASARLEQRLIDPARQPQIALERAQLAEQRARVQTALYAVRQQVREAFFAAYGIRERLVVLGTSITTLLGNRDEANARLTAGTAVPADVAEVDAAILDLQQESRALDSQLRGLLQRLSVLTGRSLDITTPLAVPDAAEVMARAERSVADRRRPEYVQFAETRVRLRRQADVVAAQQRPRLSAFGRLGYGRPGLNFIGDRFDVYGVVGLQLQWRPDVWGTADREREALRLQQEIVDADEAAFTTAVQAALPTAIYPLQRLQQALADDDRIITLREQVERTASARLGAGAITMAEYLARNAELTQARNARAARRVELADKAAEILDTAGEEIP